MTSVLPRASSSQRVVGLADGAAASAAGCVFCLPWYATARAMLAGVRVRRRALSLCASRLGVKTKIYALSSRAVFAITTHLRRRHA